MYPLAHTIRISLQRHCCYDYDVLQNHRSWGTLLEQPLALEFRLLLETWNILGPETVPHTHMQLHHRAELFKNSNTTFLQQKARCVHQHRYRVMHDGTST